MKIDEEELEDSEDEGEELLKQVKDRKQSIAKLNMSPQEKDLMKRLSTAGEGIIKLSANLFQLIWFIIILSYYNRNGLMFTKVSEKLSGQPSHMHEVPTLKNDIPSSK